MTANNAIATTLLPAPNAAEHAAAQNAPALTPAQVRKELSQPWEQAVGNNVLYQEATKAAAATGNAADPRFHLFINLANKSGQKALLFQQILDRWGKEHDLAGAPPVELSRDFVLATLNDFAPFGMPEILRLHRAVRKDAETLRRQLETSPASAAACTAEEREEILALAEYEVTFCDQAISLMRDFDAYLVGDAAFAPAW